MATILSVDDEPIQLRLTEETLVRFGHQVRSAKDGHEALALLKDEEVGPTIDAVLLDLLMPGMDGLAVLAELQTCENKPPVIVQTAKGSIETVISAMRAGAFDFVVKPVGPERLRTAVDAALKVHARACDNSTDDPLAGRGSATNRFGLMTRSPAMERVLELVEKAAQSTIPVMIEGESGTGKERIARAIGGGGLRASKPMVTVNCGAIPSDLVESILFGHEKGSFTGAHGRHAGKFVEADGGTLFLDEIGDLPLEAQVKLLRAVQEGEVDPVGGSRTQKVDVRFVSATHQNLIEAVREKRFREDLYYRLSVFPIRVPPLRERREDIGLLADRFVKRFAKNEAKTDLKGIDPTAKALLERYDWPGNIRQLENAIFRAVVLADGPMLTSDLFPQVAAQLNDFDTIEARVGAGPGFSAASESDRFRTSLHDDAEDDDAAGDGPEAAPAPASPAAVSVPAFGEDGEIRSIEEMEGDLIRLAIEHYDGRLSEVAQRLGVGRSTLYRKLRELRIELQDIRAAS